jgi:hypothetical protein
MSNTMYDSMNNAGNDPMNGQSGKPLSPFAKAMKIVTAPSEAAAAIRQKPDVLLPILIMIVLSLLPVLGNYQAYLDTLVQALSLNPNSSSMTADQLRELAQISAYTGIAFSPVLVVGGWLLGSLILFGFVRMFGGECRYKQLLSLKGYTMIFGLIAVALTVVISRLTGADSPSRLHLAGFRFPDISGGFLAGVVSGIEVFSIWSVVVTGIGVSVIAGISRKKAYIIVGVLFALGLLLTGLSGVVGASFTGM